MSSPAEHSAHRSLLRSAQGAALRNRTFAVLETSVVVWASVYIALVAITGHTYIRSIAFGLAAAFALWLVLGALFSDAPSIPLPDGYLVLAILAWAGWSAASWMWSIHPRYTLAEIGTEIGWGLTTALVFYVAGRSGHAFRSIVTVTLAAAAWLSVLAIYAIVAHPDADPEKLLVSQHGGVGAFSTYLVLVVPLVPLLLAPRPAGYGAGATPLVVTATTFLLLLAGARITENRMIWVALAVGFVTAAVLAGWRWRARLVRAPKRWGVLLAALLVAFAVLFADATLERAHTIRMPDATITKALSDDPRFVLWEHAFERIAQRPWIGYGYGKSILRDEFQAELGNPLLVHAHNLFVSQWLQTGVIGVVTLVGLLGALALRYARFMRASDGTLAAIGVMGLTLLAMFVAKSMTDDFFVRPSSKEFWACNALLVGYGMRRLTRPWAPTRGGPRDAHVVPPGMASPHDPRRA
ncbi:MAG: O-antigen ligase family protein [Burkholderiales bacterium]|nr:O-antigen ligase family protein [Burkholderiales bacterium]